MGVNDHLDTLEVERTVSGLPVVDLTFNIDEGKLAPIRGVRFIGNRVYDEQQLWSVMKQFLNMS